MEAKGPGRRDQEPRTCPKCGWPVEPGERFCQCGAELESEGHGMAGATSLPKGAKAHSARDTDEDGDTVIFSGSSNVGDLAAADPPTTVIPPQPTTSHEPQTTLLSDCQDLLVEYNQARVFLTGFTSSFNFRITPRLGVDSTLEDLRLRVEATGFLAEPLTYKSRLKEVRGGRPLPEINLGLEPERSGQDIPGEVYLSYSKDGRRHVYVGSFLWDVYPPSESSASVIENLSVKIGDIVSTGDRAGDARTTVNFLDGLQDSGRYSKAEELRKLKLPKAWNALPLGECDPGEFPCPPELGEPPFGARAATLTLETADGRLLHLLHPRGATQLGRNRRCDIVAREMDADGTIQNGPWQSRISRFHCRIRKTGDECVILDGDDSKSSGHGTWMNGVPVSKKGKTVELDERFVLTLAGRRPGEPGVFSLDGRLWSCSAQGKCGMMLHSQCTPECPAALVLKRRDGVPETFFIVWQFCMGDVVGSVLPQDLGPVCFFRHKNAFGIRYGDREQCFEWLVPGKTLGVDGNIVKVKAYQQFGEWAEEGSEER